MRILMKKYKAARAKSAFWSENAKKGLRETELMRQFNECSLMDSLPEKSNAKIIIFKLK